MQDSITKEAYSATQFGGAAIDIFGDGDTVRNVTTDKWWPDCSILIFVAVDLVCTPKGAIISAVAVRCEAEDGGESRFAERYLDLNFGVKMADF